MDAARAVRWAVTATLFSIVPLLILTAVRGPVDGTGDKGTGYWGEKTATVNWCESDYTVTVYIAEFGNTLSSFAIVANGLYGLYKHASFVETRYICCFLMFIVVGGGSAAFHGTLRRSMQMMDELPMVWGNSVFSFVLLTMEDSVNHARSLEAAILVVVTIAASFAISYLDESAGGQDLFLAVYGLGVVYLVLRSRALDLKYNSKGTLLLLETSHLFYAGGLVLWLCDRNFCSSVRSLHLHALWHLGAGIGTYTSVLFWMWTRNEVLQRKQKILGSTPLDRWIEMEASKLL